MKRLFTFVCFLGVLVFVQFGDARLSCAKTGIVNDALLMAKKPAKLLSEYGLFIDTGGRVPSDRVVPYDLNNPLFTDYATKLRYIYMPTGVAAASYQEIEALNFPVGSVLIKNFAYPASFKYPKTNIRYIETRLLIRKPEGWKAYPYFWNEDQNEAVLKIAGKRLKVPVEWKNGDKAIVDYAVPNVNQCKGCHTNAKKEFTPIGPKIRNLNMEYDYRIGGVKNQLDHLKDLNYLGGDYQNPAQSPRVPDPFDVTDGDIRSRARSYLDGNCAHCHSPGRPADTSGLYLDYTENRPVHWGLNKPPVAAGRGSGGLEVDIEPGKPDQSILLYRMKSTDPGIMMPELGRSLVHSEGVKLIEDFIRDLE